MSLSPNEKYPGATEADPNYKDGKFKDNNPSTTNNGSPLKAIDRNEQLALQEAVMDAAGFEYNGTVDTPENSQMFAAYKAALSNGSNLLSNHNFLISSPDDSQPAPSATPTSYPPGYQIFSGVFANETSGISNLTYIDGHVSFSGGDFYMPVANSGGLERLTDFVASVADFDGKPRTRGVSFALVGDEYRVTVGVDALEDESANATPLGSVKFEQGSVATGHEVSLGGGVYDSVSAAKKTGKPVGSLIETKGYYNAGGKGAAKYLIKTSSQALADGDVIDGHGNHQIENSTNVLILQSTMIVSSQFGAQDLIDSTLNVQAAIDKITVLGNQSGFLNNAFVNGAGGGNLWHDVRCELSDTIELGSSLVIRGTGILTAGFILNPSSHKHHMIGSSINAGKISSRSYFGLRMQDLAIVNKKDAAQWPASRMGYNPNVEHGIYLENYRLSEYTNVLFDGFVNGTADSVGYVVNEEIDSTDQSNPNFRSGLHPDEKTASTTFTGFNYKTLFDHLVSEGFSVPYQWGWNHLRNNCYYYNNHLDFWARNGGTTSKIIGGSCELSSTFDEDGAGNPLADQKRFCYYSRQTGFSVDAPIVEGGVNIESAILASAVGFSLDGYLEYNNCKSYLKLIGSKVSTSTELGGLRDGDREVLDLSDETWDFRNNPDFADSGTSVGYGDVAFGKPNLMQEYIPNQLFWAGLSNWKALGDTMDIGASDIFQGWDSYQPTKSGKVTVNYDEEWNVPVLTLEKFRTGGSSSRITSQTDDFATSTDYSNTRMYVTMIVKVEKGGSEEVPFTITYRGKQLKPKVILPNDWVVYVGSFASAASDTNLDVSLGGSANVGDKVHIHNITFSSGGWSVFPPVHRLIDCYGWPSPHPSGLNDTFTNRSVNITDRTRWAYSVLGLRYPTGATIRQSSGMKDMGSNPSVGIAQGNPLYFTAISNSGVNGYAYRIDWVAGTYYEDDLVKGSDGNVYKCINNGTTQNPVGGTDWELLGPAISWYSTDL